MERTSQKLRATAAFLLKVGVAGGILAWLLSRVDITRVWSAVRTAHAADVLAAILLGIGALPVVGWRWQQLLRAYGIKLPIPLLMTTVHVGQLFGLVLPGSLGEDFVRTTFIARVSRSQASVVFTSVFVDRLAALLGLLVLALVAMPQHWQLLQQGSIQTRLLSTGMLTGAILALGLVLLVARISMDRLRTFACPLLTRILGSTRSESILATLEKALRSRTVFLPVTAGAISTQLLFCGMYYFCGRAVGIEASLFTWCGFVPIILTANVVPITVAGVGVRDYLLVLFLGIMSVDAPQAMAASLLILAVSLFNSLSGVLSYIWFQPRLAASIATSTLPDIPDNFTSAEEPHSSAFPGSATARNVASVLHATSQTDTR